MTDRAQYTPGPAFGAQVKQEGVEKDKWTLILVRELRHAPEKVWRALTDPEHLREWAPFDADGDLGRVGAAVKLTWVATKQVSETRVTRGSLVGVIFHVVTRPTSRRGQPQYVDVRVGNQLLTPRAARAWFSRVHEI